MSYGALAVDTLVYTLGGVDVTVAVSNVANGTFSGAINATSFTPTGNAVPLNGVYSPSANTVGISTSGTQRILFGAGGNVGVGPSTSLGTRIDANTTGTDSCIIRARNDNTSVYLDANNGYAYLNCFSNHPLLFGTNNTERMQINNTGAVGFAGANFGTAGQVIKSQGSSAAPIWGNAIDYQEFLSSGTWTKPAGAISVYVEVVGGGGGGGAGGRYATTQTRGGGGSGAGGVYLNRWFKASDLSPTVSVTVGAGGAGGAAAVVDNTTGSNGTDGGQSSFGTLLQSGTAGAGGFGATSNGSAGVVSSRAASATAIFAGAGAVGSTNKSGFSGSNSVYGGAGGGGGGGAQFSSTASSTGGSGGVATALAASMTGAAANTAGITGGGGGGGSYTTGTTGMSGGAGGFPGGGGGGGSSSDNDFNSGAGGPGGAGVVRVWSY